MNRSELPFMPPHLLSGLDEKTPILIAFSGGADSRALLEILARYASRVGAPLYAAHVNHGLRGEDAERDEAFCRRVAEEHGLPFFCRRADVASEARKSGESEEEAGRRIRYAFFDELMAEHGIPLLATAHNADDNLETLLFRLLRGSGLHGICGIPPTRPCAHGTVIRPLLQATKTEIVAYCRENGFAYVTDATNADVTYPRNRLRARVLPELRAITDSPERAAARLCSLLREDDDYLEGVARAAWQKGTEKLDGEILASLPRPIASRVLRQYAEERGCSALDAKTTRDILEDVGAGTETVRSLPGGFDAIVDRGGLTVLPRTEKAPFEPYLLPLSLAGEGEVKVAGFAVSWRPEHENDTENSENLDGSVTSVTCSRAILTKKLFLRPMREGDRIYAGGMHKRVRKLFNARRLPRSLRERLPLLVAGEEIWWVPFCALRDGATDRTSGGIRLTLRETKPDETV